MDAGGRATLAFNGTGAKFVAYQDPWSGIARVLVDGALMGEIDTWASPAKAQATAYAVSGLSSGSHTLTVEVTGRKNARSGGAWVWIDAFDVTSASVSADSSTAAPAPTTTTATASTSTTVAAPAPAPAPTGSPYRIDDRSGSLTYSGSWYPNGYSFHYGGGAKLSMAAGARVTMTFTGTSVSWIAYRDEWSGIARVYLDGSLRGEVDTYAAPSARQAIAYSISGLPWNTHTITIEATGRKNSSSGGAWVWIDAFDYVGQALP
jgi:alpha-amylase